MKPRLCISCILLCLCACSFAQQADSSLDRFTDFPNKLFGKIRSKTSHLDDQLTKQTEKYLARLAKKEKKLQEKLSKTDSNAARNLFSGTQERYVLLTAQLKNETGQDAKPLSGEYLPYIDSLKGSLSFLSQNQKLLDTSPQLQSQITGSLQQFNQLQSKLQQTEQINEFIRQRKQQLKDALSRYTGFNKYLDEYNKDVYYYSTQVKEYKELLNDPNKLTKKALSILNKIPAFQSFLKSTGQLAGLFGITSDYGTPQGLMGLQTREQVQQMLQGQISTGGSGGMAAFQQNLEAAHQQLDLLKDKLSKLGGGSGDIDMPDFKPNQHKTKSFLKRLEIGTNLQTTRANNFFPSTTDLGLSLGFKATDKITIGVGGSYKLGWGEPLNHIHMSSQGLGLRSFIDMKLKGSFYASGGMEYNCQQPFGSIDQLRRPDVWSRSGLIGITKTISFSGKLVKKTKVQLLWDFLSYSQRPRTDPFKFRVGYNFK